MGCSHTNIKDKKSPNYPRLNDQNANFKRFDENKTKTADNHEENKTNKTASKNAIDLKDNEKEAIEEHKKNDSNSKNHPEPVDKEEKILKKNIQILKQNQNN